METSPLPPPAEQKNANPWMAVSFGLFGLIVGFILNSSSPVQAQVADAPTSPPPIPSLPSALARIVPPPAGAPAAGGCGGGGLGCGGAGGGAGCGAGCGGVGGGCGAINPTPPLPPPTT